MPLWFLPNATGLLTSYSSTLPAWTFYSEICFSLCLQPILPQTSLAMSVLRGLRSAHYFPLLLMITQSCQSCLGSLPCNVSKGFNGSCFYSKSLSLHSSTGSSRNTLFHVQLHVFREFNKSQWKEWWCHPGEICHDDLVEGWDWECGERGCLISDLNIIEWAETSLQLPSIEQPSLG